MGCSFSTTAPVITFLIFVLTKAAPYRFNVLELDDLKNVSVLFKGNAV